MKEESSEAAKQKVAISARRSTRRKKKSLSPSWGPQGGAGEDASAKDQRVELTLEGTRIEEGTEFYLAGKCALIFEPVCPARPSVLPRWLWRAPPAHAQPHTCRLNHHRAVSRLSMGAAQL